MCGSAPDDARGVSTCRALCGAPPRRPLVRPLSWRCAPRGAGTRGRAHPHTHRSDSSLHVGRARRGSRTGAPEPHAYVDCGPMPDGDARRGPSRGRAPWCDVCRVHTCMSTVVSCRYLTRDKFMTRDRDVQHSSSRRLRTTALLYASMDRAMYHARRAIHLSRTVFLLPLYSTFIPYTAHKDKRAVQI